MLTNQPLPIAAFIVARENSLTSGFCNDLTGGRAV